MLVHIFDRADLESTVCFFLNDWHIWVSPVLRTSYTSRDNPNSIHPKGRILRSFYFEYLSSARVYSENMALLVATLLALPNAYDEPHKELSVFD